MSKPDDYSRGCAVAYGEASKEAMDRAVKFFAESQDGIASALRDLANHLYAQAKICEAAEPKPDPKDAED